MKTGIRYTAAVTLSFLVSVCTGSDESIGHINHAALEVQDVRFFAESVQREMAFNIVLPADYGSSGKRYPVLYLLHGLTANYHEWKYLGVPEYLNRFDMLVVMVDIGNSWYVNWALSEDGQTNNFADYVIDDLIPLVDRKYRTIAQRNGRAIGGLSMGGYGALTLGLQNPQLFCSLGSHSGALKWAADQRAAIEAGKDVWIVWENALADSTQRYFDINVAGFASQRERTPAGQPFVTAEDASAADPFRLVLQVPREQLPQIYLDCGLQDGLIDASKEFVDLLMEHDIPFVYGQSAGAHNADYWWREVNTSMAVQYAMILRNLWTAERQAWVPAGD